MSTPIIPPVIGPGLLTQFFQNIFSRLLNIERRLPGAAIPHAIGYRTSAGSFASGSWLNFTAHDTQTLRGGMTYDTATGTYTVPRDGVYAIDAQVGWAANATSWRGIAVSIGGWAHYGYDIPGSTTQASIPAVSLKKFLTAGSTIAVQIRQQSGGTLAIDTTSGYGFVSIAYEGA